MTEELGRKSARSVAREQAEQARPRRFYEEASAEPRGGRHVVLLDRRPVRTPKGSELAVPTAALASAIAVEWALQGERIDPCTMPLTRIANSALDGVAPRIEEVRADLVTYAGSDLLCYRADHPSELVRRQAERWDPVLAWAHAALGARFILAEGVMPVSQMPEAADCIHAAIASFDPFELAALHVMTTLTGSVLLALAHACDRLTAEEAWSAAHVDEDWQIEQWGEDSEAALRRQLRRTEFDAASRCLALRR